ncbi:hypothetical protein BJ508DRAFT_366671 [Ascobolus immersus RN42]|uniref:Uncharacterized protein n=1 Tax=Ascobolus immersus RN42 TaxID=1160509 RepID=A0A3N4HHU2_ASCIM|nr:hypothetical protein BJ508DRAFT_366671 [Ascobolus immersus RN42]
MPPLLPHFRRRGWFDLLFITHSFLLLLYHHHNIFHQHLHIRLFCRFVSLLCVLFNTVIALPRSFCLSLVLDRSFFCYSIIFSLLFRLQHSHLWTRTLKKRVYAKDMKPSALIQTILSIGVVSVHGGPVNVRLPTLNVVESSGLKSLDAGPQPPARPAANQKDGCKRTYEERAATLGFENLGHPCQRGQCIPMGSMELRHDRGAGFAAFGETVMPVLYSNAYDWHVINCTHEQYDDKPEAKSCGASSKALWSIGKAKENEKAPARFNSNKFPDDYLYFDLKSLFITTFVNVPNLKTAIVTFTGKRKDGQELTHTAKVINKERIPVTFPQNLFDTLVSFDVAVQIGGSSIDAKKLWPFALDDVAINEYIPRILPDGCNPRPKATGAQGPCSPRPTETRMVTARADEFKVNYSPFGLQVPHTYQGLSWPSEVTVHNISSINHNGERFWPGTPQPASKPNFFYGAGEVTWVATTQENRFGLEEISMACSFTRGNGEPCVITFVGRRDPYDGSGLPTIIEAKFTMKNPGGDMKDRALTKIDLNKLTTRAGAFHRLVRLSIFVDIAGTQTVTPFVFDNVKLSKELGEGVKCRVPGAKTVNFDDLKQGAPIPSVYQGFSFNEGTLEISDKRQFGPEQPGFLAITSSPNAARSPRGFEYDRPAKISSYISPSKEMLFDLESITLTVDIDAKNKTALNAFSFAVTVTDACGTMTNVFGKLNERLPWYNWVALEPGRSQVILTYPYKAISELQVNSIFPLGSVYFGKTVGFWIDDFKYRKYDGPTPGCVRCGWNLAYMCELPTISR